MHTEVSEIKKCQKDNYLFSISFSSLILESDMEEKSVFLGDLEKKDLNKHRKKNLV